MIGRADKTMMQANTNALAMIEMASMDRLPRDAGKTLKRGQGWNDRASRRVGVQTGPTQALAGAKRNPAQGRVKVLSSRRLARQPPRRYATEAAHTKSNPDFSGSFSMIVDNFHNLL